MVPSGTLLMASTGAKFSMYYGAISILNQRTEKWETVAGKYVPDTFIKKRPDRRFRFMVKHHGHFVPFPIIVEARHRGKFRRVVKYPHIRRQLCFEVH